MEDRKSKKLKPTKVENSKGVAYIRKDGWIFSEEGIRRITEAGKIGHQKFMNNMKEQVGGEWVTMARRLYPDVVASIKSVKGFVNRTLFVSQAIINEAKEMGLIGKRTGKNTSTTNKKGGK